MAFRVTQIKVKTFNLINFLSQKVTVTGPAKPPVPKSDSKFQVLPLKVLLSAQVSLNRAKEIDFHFMQLIVNDVEVPE